MEGEVRLNDLYFPRTIEDFFSDPYKYDDLFVRDDKEELSRGKVEICVDGVWGTICEGKSWNNSAASVTCHQLGFSRLGTYVYTEDVSGPYHERKMHNSHKWKIVYWYLKIGYRGADGER